MFRPSQNLLFRPMPTLNKFKIHPPLPLNPRESKQLLNLLTASFRQQLDAEHGRWNPKPSTNRKENETAKQRRRSTSVPGSQPTDKHMHSILANPLFSLSPDGKTSKEDPMEVFDQAVARGMMTIPYARACLYAKKLNIIQSPVLKVRDGMKESAAGLKVLKWLISSGTANDNNFLEDGPFAHIFMEYLVAEGLQEVVWKWIQRAFRGIPRYFTLHVQDPKQEKIRRREIVRPLYLLIKAEASEEVSLDAAYMCISRAAGYLKGLTATEMRILLDAPGRFLAHASTSLNSERPPPSTSAFESFVSLVPVLSKDSKYQLAHLSLIHPSEPSADLALDFLRWREYPGFDPSLEQTRDKDEIALGLDTAKFLLEHEQYEDADWVMNFLRKRHSHHLGIKGQDQFKQAMAEVSSLQLLESLSIV